MADKTLAYEQWREQVEGGIAEHLAHGKTPKAEPKSETEWLTLYDRQPRSLYATWYVLTGRTGSV